MPTTGKYNGPISLYFHIPFCTKKCDYCHFYVLPNKPELHKLLAEGLDRELQLWSPDIAGKKVVSVYFGGGTPFLFGPKAIGHVIEEVSKYTDLLNTDLEVTLEANPEHITLAAMQEYAAVGINRVSIGVQSLDDPLLKRLSRTHGSAEAIKALEATYQSGITNISIDLMYDIPGQTLDAWKNTLERVEPLPITHLSLYNLTIEPQTVFFKYRDTIAKEMPGSDVSTEMYLMAVDTLTNYGFDQYEISAFSKEGLYSRHNTGYWQGRPFLGIGPSAFSYWEGKRFRSIANIHKYIDALRGGSKPIDFSEELEPDKMQRELLAIGLRMLCGIDLKAFAEDHGRLSKEIIRTLEKLVRDELLSMDGDIVALTPRGILLHDTVAVELV
jgi:oxygen-independent coproporphyrinogen-3 oxidase